MAAFIDPPIRHGRVLPELALVLVVDVKGYIPIDDTPLPVEVEGLKTDVRAGIVSAMASNPHHSHPNAWDPRLPKCYIGRSVGPESSYSEHGDKLTAHPGTIGAVPS